MLGLAVESFVWPIAIIVYTYQPKIVKSFSKINLRNDAMKAPVLLIIIKKEQVLQITLTFCHWKTILGYQLSSDYCYSQGIWR